ncbi:MAG: hypothetical protein CM15mP74_22540 [Halieaceae bacterium]|nr:MAG: hypothetical protein CM15mP74_22540 [Halieaceae bacterium]
MTGNFVPGTPISALFSIRRRRLRAKIQIVQQDPTDTFDPRRTLAWSLGEPFRIHRQSSERQVNIAVQELVERVGLDATLLDSRPAEVTPSNLQRFAIARALATDPMIILDDQRLFSPYDRESLLQLLGDLQRALSLSYLFISRPAFSHRRMRASCNHAERTNNGEWANGIDFLQPRQ